MELRLHDFEDCYIDKDTLETSDVIEGGAELFLYQTGYLTIKDFDEDGYSLGFPNEEVKNRIRQEFFQDYDATPILGDIDFAVTTKKSSKGELFDHMEDEVCAF